MGSELSSHHMISGSYLHALASVMSIMKEDEWEFARGGTALRAIAWHRAAGWQMAAATSLLMLSVVSIAMMLLRGHILSHGLPAKFPVTGEPSQKCWPSRFLPCYQDSWGQWQVFWSPFCLGSRDWSCTLWTSPWLLLEIRKKEKELWSLPSSNIMESVSLGFGRKRCWWQHDRVTPSCSRLLFLLSDPLPVQTGTMGSPQCNLSPGSPGKHTSHLGIKQTNISLWILSRPRSLVSPTWPVGPQKKHKPSRLSFDLTPSLERFNQLTMKSLHFVYADLSVKRLWSGWHFPASEIKDGSKYHIQPE